VEAAYAIAKKPQFPMTNVQFPIANAGQVPGLFIGNWKLNIGY
jgi:hypothetical protein